MWACRWNHVSCLRQVRSTSNNRGLPGCQQLHRNLPLFFFFSGLSVFFSWLYGGQGTRTGPVGPFFIIKNEEEEKEGGKREDELKIVDRRMVVWRRRVWWKPWTDKMERKGERKRVENDCFVPKSTGKLGLSLSLSFYLSARIRCNDGFRSPKDNSCDFLSTQIVTLLKKKFGLSVDNGKKRRERVTSAKRRRASCRLLRAICHLAVVSICIQLSAISTTSNVCWFDSWVGEKTTTEKS